jgi:oligopeptide/dipeptide ABC transporter ATP-binding protein
MLRRERAVVHAVEHVDLDIARGETVGLVGESGCGKSTVARLILRLLEASAGEIHFDGQDLRRLSRRKLRTARRRIQIVFQDPFASLNPRMQVGEAIGEGLRIHRVGTPVEQRARVIELLEIVGLRADQAERYPHEFSGGQRQRIGIARALALGPDLIVGDEPVSSLDVSIQAQILNLMLDLQAKLGLAYLLISHDLRVVRHLCDRVAVMYLGRIVEQGTVADVYERPQHPYTIALLSAAPVIEPGTGRQRIVLRGDVPSAIDPPAGCAFHPRCRRAVERCATERPALREVRPGHLSACHLAPLDAAPGLAQSTPEDPSSPASAGEPEPRARPSQETDRT